jgi:hypothetical protein
VRTDSSRIRVAPPLHLRCDAFGALMLLFEELAQTERVPFRYYAMILGLISGGLGMIGVGQGLRLLLLIVDKD